LQRQASFAEAALGPHLVKIRDLLNNEDPGHRGRYGCVLIGFRGGSVDRVGRPPISCRVDGHRSLLFLMAGLIRVFVVSAHSEWMKGQDSFLGTEGVLRVHIGSGTAQDFLASVGESLTKAGLI